MSKKATKWINGENLLSFDRQKISERFNPIVSVVCVGSQDQAIDMLAQKQERQ